jgi:Nucleotidyltransferase of unknown function (DUF6036)
MFDRVLETIALGLEARGLPYMVIGGQAVLLYGEPRLTKDIDITLGVGTERLGDVLDMVRSWDWEILVPDPQPFVQQTMVLPCLEPTSGIRVDFIFSWSPYERQAMEHVRRVPIGLVEVRFASPEDVVVHKVIAGRPRDLEDARTIVLKTPNLDREYIQDWLARFQDALGEPFLARWEEAIKHD